MFEAGGYEIAFDHEHSTVEEDRFIAQGRIAYQGEVFVVFIEIESSRTPNEDTIRIIFARKWEG